PIVDGDGDGGGGVAGGGGGLDAHRVRVERGGRVGAGVGGQDDAALAGRVGVEHDLRPGVPGGGDATVQGTVHVGADTTVPQPGPAGRGRPVEVGDAGVVHAAHHDQGVTGLHRAGDRDDGRPGLRVRPRRCAELGGPGPPYSTNVLWST